MPAERLAAEHQEKMSQLELLSAHQAQELSSLRDQNYRQSKQIFAHLQEKEQQVSRPTPVVAAVQQPSSSLHHHQPLHSAPSRSVPPSQSPTPPSSQLSSQSPSARSSLGSSIADSDDVDDADNSDDEETQDNDDENTLVSPAAPTVKQPGDVATVIHPSAAVADVHAVATLPPSAATSAAAAASLPLRPLHFNSHLPRSAILPAPTAASSFASGVSFGVDKDRKGGTSSASSLLSQLRPPSSNSSINLRTNLKSLLNSKQTQVQPPIPKQ